MAFSPFHAFRKHQRVIFAALTIMCMFSFVLFSGVTGGKGGDAFYELARMFGGEGRFSTAASINGVKVDEQELKLLRVQRDIANRFITMAVFTAHDNIIQEIQQAKLDESINRQVMQVVQGRMLAQFGMAREYISRLPQFLGQLEMIESNLDATKKTAEAEKIRLLRRALQQEAWIFNDQKDDLYPGYNLYFGGSVSPEGLVDFLLWKQEADRLGIQLTPEDVQREVARETLGRLPVAQSAAIEENLNRSYRNASGVLMQSLTDEFRVRLAQSAVLGYDPGGYPRVPAQVTPYELWEFYQKNRTEANVKLLPIPVQHFLAQVKEKPTEKDLTELFDKHKDEEYAPFKETPGFKQPRRIKAEWVEVGADAPYYKKTTRAWLLSALASTPTNPTAAVAIATRILREYDSYKTFGNIGIPGEGEGDFALAVYSYAYQARPETAAAVVGQALGMGGTGANPLAFAFTHPAGAVAREAKELAPVIARERERRAPAAGALVGAGTAPHAWIALAGLWTQMSKAERHVPMEVMGRALISRVEESLTQDLVSESIASFKKALEEKRGRPEEAAKVIDEAAKKYGWQHGATTELHGPYDLAQDPKLASLKAAYEKAHTFDDPKGKRLAFTLFFNRPPEQSRPYTPEDMRVFEDNKTVVYWKTADEPAKTLTFEQARPQVEAAWKLEKARELAVKAADEVAALAKKAKGPDAVRNLNDAAKQFGTTPFELFGVARLKPVMRVREGLGGQYEGYTVPEDRIEYPSGDFVERVMQMKQPGDVEVLTDRPREHYYVTVLTERIEPKIKEFYKDTSPGPLSGGSNFLLDLFEAERRHEYREAATKQLREKAQVKYYKEGMDKVADRRNAPEE